MASIPFSTSKPSHKTIIALSACAEDLLNSREVWLASSSTHKVKACMYYFCTENILAHKVEVPENPPQPLGANETLHCALRRLKALSLTRPSNNVPDYLVETSSSPITGHQPQNPNHKCRRRSDKGRARNRVQGRSQVMARSRTCLNRRCSPKEEEKVLA